MAFFLLLLMASFFAPLSAPGVGGASGASCKCVPSNLCGGSDAGVNGDGQLDVRFTKLCPNPFEVCCEHPISPPKLPNGPPTHTGCGHQNPISLNPRITSDSQQAKFGELPWTVIILTREISLRDLYSYKCGGSLIHPQVALTAAHCVSDVATNILIIRAGEWDTKNKEEPFPHQEQAVDEILIYPNFHKGTLRNDIALIFLTDPFTLAPNIGLICLPPPNFQRDEALCTVGGWGKATFKGGKYSTVLRKVDVPLVPKERCAAALRRTRLGGFFKLHKSFICAGGEVNKDSCKGDGGSPLVCPIYGGKEGYFQAGIVSWGIGCGESDVPGVYTNVALFSKWIDDELALRNLDFSFYKY